MSLFQCEVCGCCDNTALTPYHTRDIPEIYTWDGIEDRAGKKLCSACGPGKFSDGTPTNYGKWHGQFKRVFLPKGMFRTAKDGNLEHIETGDQDYKKYEID